MGRGFGLDAAGEEMVGEEGIGVVGGVVVVGEEKGVVDK